jgi:hypothetical protein
VIQVAAKAYRNQIALGTATTANGQGTNQSFSTSPTTYMVLFSLTNVNSGSNGVLKRYVLTSAQYDDLAATHPADFDTALTARAAGAASTNVFASASSNVTTPYINFNPGTGLANPDLVLFDYYTPATYDEVRISNTSFAEAAAVPEPTAMIMLGAAPILLLIRRRRAV